MHRLLIQTQSKSPTTETMCLCKKCTFIYNINKSLLCPMCNTNFMDNLIYEDDSMDESSDEDVNKEVKVDRKRDERDDYYLFYLDGKIIDSNKLINFLVDTSKIDSYIPYHLYKEYKLDRYIKTTSNNLDHSILEEIQMDINFNNTKLTCVFKIVNNIQLPTLGIKILSDLGVKIDMKNMKLEL